MHVTKPLKAKKRGGNKKGKEYKAKELQESLIPSDFELSIPAIVENYFKYLTSSSSLPFGLTFTPALSSKYI